MGACDFRCCTCLPLFVVMFGDSPNDLLNNLNEEHPLVVAVEYISKEESADVAAGSASAKHGVTGILAVQGAFAEHAAMLDRLGAPWKLLRAAEDFDDSIDRVILPGGESTTQGKLLRSTGLFEPIAAHIAAGKPVFGTCAGMILLARRLDNDENVYFGALDAVVRRNAYGRQLGSFAASADFGASDDADAVVVASGESVSSAISAAAGEEGASEASDTSVVLKDFPLVFIRGPFVAEVGERATVETSVDGNVVGLRQGKILATAFHPELTDDTRIHELFLSL
mgnify:CR=1 FL=1